MKRQFQFGLGCIGVILIGVLLSGCNKTESLDDNKDKVLKDITKSTIIVDGDKEYTLYYYGVEKVSLKINKQNYDLTDAIRQKRITFDEIISEMELAGSLYDGGTKIYKSGNSKKYLNDDLTIIRCHTLDGNRDVYIGDDSMQYEEGFCLGSTTREANIDLVTELILKSSVTQDNHYIDGEEELIEYKVMIKNKKLYATNLETDEERVIFDKEEVSNIAVRPICCTGNGNLLILTTKGNVYLSEKDCNYSFSFDFPFQKLEAQDIVAFKLIPASDNDVTKNLYGVDSKGNQILLQKIN